MAFRVEISPKSLNEIESIVEYYYLTSERAAEDIYNSIIFRIETLVEFAERGRMVPELLEEGITKYRELIEGNFRIIYRINGKVVIIIRVVDSRQLFVMDME